MQEATRREKRRLLDAQRGKCRIRLGSHLDEWCALKNHLGFSLHSQLAKFLLDSYRLSTKPEIPVSKPITLLSVPVHSLHHLALLCHQHGRNCNSPPAILAQPCSLIVSESPVLLWGCKKDHQFHWDPNAAVQSNNAVEDITDLSSIDQNSAMEQENVPKETIEEGPVINTENRLQGTGTKPHDIAVQERLYENQPRIQTSVQPEQCNDPKRTTEVTSEDRLHMTPGNEWSLKSSVSEKPQDQVIVTNEGLCQSIGHEILDPTVEDGDTEDEDSGPQHVEASEDTQESISTDLVKEKPETLISGRTCRHRRTCNKLSQICQQTIMTEPKQPLAPLPCRRSPRGNRPYCPKADMKEQVSHSKDPITSLTTVGSDEKGQDLDVLAGSPSSADLEERICHVQESLTEDVSQRKTPSENFERLAAGEEHKEPQSESIQMSKALGEDEPSSEMKQHENEGQDPQSTQYRSQKSSRRKSLVDEELAQICKKRIRKATPQELLMCEYDDCGKIFSKRQYLNYHQKYQHMNQRTFRCSVTECGKTFNFKKHLKEHEKRHSDQRDFICEFCARAFRSSSNLIIHRRIHTGEKPLQCEFCGFTCRQKASLNWHMKKHDADSFYKFPCDICGQRFEKRDNLAAHKSRKHPAPREIDPKDPAPCIVSSMNDACQAEASCKEDHTGQSMDPDQEITTTPPEGGKEYLFTDLSESVQEGSQQTAPTPGNAGLSLVIVL
ncbi:zinc finger protein 692-like isoform 2-T2 [Anomaloglossus baeobatrachus]|uniref:zinc finger protein 692-like isoform X2 n=1 Tax=Anomaloglossus baeobatrachus TaxID=238106 RepID=UPI003F5060A6